MDRLEDYQSSYNDSVPGYSTEDESVDVFMCREVSCAEIFISYLADSDYSIHCAFFDFNLERMDELLESMQVEKLVYVDGDNHDFNSAHIIYEHKSSYMHNKFCVIDNDTVITGSFNPTKNDETINDNNIVVLKSGRIAAIYQDYFGGLMEEYRSSYKNRTKMARNYDLIIDGMNISICFSRGGHCNEIILKEIMESDESIHFMLFSLTEERIADFMIYAEYIGLNVKGMMEKSLITRYSSYGKLDNHLDGIKKDCSSGKLHHKVFIIDGKVVITGSFNPGSNAENDNDENMLIIRDHRIAEKYLKEFNRLYDWCHNET